MTNTLARVRERQLVDLQRDLDEVLGVLDDRSCCNEPDLDAGWMLPVVKEAAAYLNEQIEQIKGTNK